MRKDIAVWVMILAVASCLCCDAEDASACSPPDLNFVVAKALCENSPQGKEVAECAVVYRVADGARIATACIGAIAPDLAFEPGSIIKPVSVLAAMECGVATPDSLYDTKREDPRYVLLPGDGAHVWPEKMSVADALVRSSNIVIGKLGYDVGPKNLLSTFAAFGIGSQGGELPKYDRVDKATWSRLAIGQGFTTTLDEMARAYVVLANHGRSPWTNEQIVPKTTADAVALVLRRVPTNEGTARRAAVPGLTVAGKTGTAQMIEGDRYVPRYHGTFIGFFPAEEPRFVVAVLSRSNNGQKFYQGGHYPAHAFAVIAKKLLAKCGSPTKECCAVEAERPSIVAQGPNEK